MHGTICPESAGTNRTGRVNVVAMTNGASAPPIFSVNNLRVIYGGATEAIRDVSFKIMPGQVVALLGANGAGKSTVLKAASGILDAEDGVIEKGEILFDGEDIGRADSADIVRKGLVHVPEGRRLFAQMTVDENLTVGGHNRSANEMAERRDEVYEMFPALKKYRHKVSGYLSGGEQQMVAVGRALMSRPRILALDEPSLGLAPMIVNDILGHVRKLATETGLTILLVEQNANKALEIADYGYIMENGRIVLDGTAEALTTNRDVREFYLGVRAEGKSSLRDVKHYKRRKRWLS